MNRKAFLLLTLFLLGIISYSQDTNFHIYLCFGQSNMEGQGLIEEQDKIVDNRFKVMAAIDCPNLERIKGQWYATIPPLCQCNSKLSPADYFGRTMIENLPDSIIVGIINVPVIGCDIRLFDKDLYQDYDSTYTDGWFLYRVNAYEGNPYQYLINLAKLAQKDGIIKGILLHQGESNTGDRQWLSMVKTIYYDILTDLSLYPDSVPLLAGELVNADMLWCTQIFVNLKKSKNKDTMSYLAENKYNGRVYGYERDKRLEKKRVRSSFNSAKGFKYKEALGCS